MSSASTMRRIPVTELIVPDMKKSWDVSARLLLGKRGRQRLPHDRTERALAGKRPRAQLLIERLINHNMQLSYQSLLWVVFLGHMEKYTMF